MYRGLAIDYGNIKIPLYKENEKGGIDVYIETLIITHTMTEELLADRNATENTAKKYIDENINQLNKYKKEIYKIDGHEWRYLSRKKCKKFEGKVVNYFS